jgi:hypothetical protein
MGLESVHYGRQEIDDTLAATLWGNGWVGSVGRGLQIMCLCVIGFLLLLYVFVLSFYVVVLGVLIEEAVSRPAAELSYNKPRRLLVFGRMGGGFQC